MGALGNLAVINIIGLSPLAEQPVFGGDAALSRVLTWAASIPEASGIVLLAESGRGEPETRGIELPVQTMAGDAWTEEELIAALSEVGAEHSDAGAIFYAWGDCPLLDMEVTRTLWKLHYRYDAQYTFADGYPVGLAPEILSPALPGKLLPLAANRGREPARDSIFEVLRQDINAFDVETHLAPVDLRMDRVSVTCDTRRNRNIAERLFESGGVDAESLCRLIPQNRALLRDLPVYFPIQVTNHCPQACSYCPFPQFGGDPREGREHMDLERFADLCRRIAEFAGDAVIAPSLWGEPSSHPQIGALVDAALAAGETPGGAPATRVLIETSGMGWDVKLLERWAADVPPGRITWIVSLDAADAEIYHRLRGDGQEEAEECARLLTRLFGPHAWVQAVRMDENDEHLEDFHTAWKKLGAGVIIQKYNNYAAYLPSKQPADLSPLERFPCWHMKRDMPILLDGTVPVCREALGRSKALGNAFDDDLAQIWAGGVKLNEAHTKGEYPGPCADCDEYYTFNF